MKQYLTKSVVRNIMVVVAIIILAISVALCKISLFGIDPFQCLMSGLGEVITFVPFTTMYVGVSVAFFVAMCIWGRKYIGIGTFVSMFLFGYVMEWVKEVLEGILGEPGFFARCIILAIALCLLMFGAAVFFTADRGVSVYDFIALTVADRGIAPFRLFRVFTDCLCVTIGFICGLNFSTGIGVGTIITAFCMGPSIDFLRKHVTDPFLAQFPDAETAKVK